MTANVSVIIPVYNCERFIAEAVDSVLAQSFRDFELIVVDDGSTDRTAEVVKSYGPRLTYIYQTNQERSAARNAGIRRASGQYLAFLDADDIWLPQKLERQIEVFDRAPEIGLVHSWAYFIDGSSQRLTFGTRNLAGSPEAGNRAFESLLFGNFIASPTPVIRAQCVRELGPFDESLVHVEDWDMWLRISARYPIAFVPEPLAGYRILRDDWLEKWERYGVAESSIMVVQRACQSFGRQASLGLLRRRALAYHRWEAARANFKLGHFHLARQHLFRALVEDRALWHHPHAKYMLVELLLLLEPLSSLRRLRRRIIRLVGRKIHRSRGTQVRV
ncbi:MAG: glycosyltransferase [Chloroflexi bacterium]|nr:glycosyltransferase [Chloroflexota bacterium]